jgi:uncharacterized protein (DUF2235 family)
MAKNIVICCDGTNNQFSGDQTNVIRTHKVARRTGAQVTFYDCGVGTMPEPWRDGWLARCWSIVAGLAFGNGFEENVADAYRFLMMHYEPGDRVFLFGFSRGAFTARAVAGMLHSVGLLHSGTENMIPYAQRYWREDFGPDSPGGKVCLDFKSTLARECPVHFIGVWDTVSSVGYLNQFRTFPHTLNNPDVTHVRHAVAIDERRACFRQNLMFAKLQEQDVKNVWFPGVHSDVGGGYPAAQAGLAKVTFEWMMREASCCGLEVDAKALAHELRGFGVAPDPCADQHESLKGLWKPVELIPMRRYNWKTNKHEWRLTLGQPRNVERDAARPEVFVHQSTIARLKGRTDYRPSNIPHTEAELRAKFKIET